MYGTIARLQVKPGALAAFKEHSDRQNDAIPGFVSQMVVQMDSDPHQLYLVAIFRDKAAYFANAESLEQHARYQEYRALLDAEPEWHDGEVVFAAEAITHGL